MKTKIHAFFAGALMNVIFLSTGLSSFASDWQEDGICYRFLDTEAKTLEVTSGGTYVGDIVIPDTILIDGSPWSIVSIGQKAFARCRDLQSIAIQGGVHTIGNYAFDSCSNLRKVTFMGTQLKNIGERAFQYCSQLDSIPLPEGIESIGVKAFLACNLQAVFIPSSVNSIGWGAYQNCHSLKSIDVDPLNESYTSIDGVLYDKDLTILLMCPAGKSECTIPDNVKIIDAFGFSSNWLITSIVIPESVTQLVAQPFADCKMLSSITCLASEPPLAERNAFDQSTQDAVVLTVPSESIDLYMEASPWRYFFTIESFSGVNTMKGDTGSKVWVEGSSIRIEGADEPIIIYDLEGKEVLRTEASAISGLTPGFYLIKIGEATHKAAIR